MPIVEVERELSDDLIKKSHSFPKRTRKAKELKILDISKYDSSGSFMDDCIGFNVVLPGELLVFQKHFARLFGRDACKELRTSKKIRTDDNTWLEVSARDYDFFLTRRGNVWGSIYAIEETENVEKRYRETIEYCHNEGWEIDRLMPPGQMASDLLGKKVYWQTMPSLSDGQIDRIHLYRAWQCLKPPVLEAMGLGRPHTKIMDYDINWAFPYALKGLPSFHPWVYDFIDSKEYHRDAIEGYLHCSVYIDHLVYIDCGGIGPLTIRAGTRDFYKCFNPIGGMVGYWTKREIDMIQDLNLGHVEILDGTWVIPKFSKTSKPFVNAVSVLEKLYRRKKMKEFAKGIAPTLWGKFASKYGSPWFNPMLAASVSSIIRERMLRLSIENSEKVVAVAADGVAISGELPVRISGRFGDMKVKEKKDFLSLSDIYRYSSEDSNDWRLDEDGIVLPMKRIGIPYMIENNLDYDSIGGNLTIQKIPYGSSRRVSPKGLKLGQLQKEWIPLSPPDESDVVELMMFSKDQLAWEVSW